MISNKWKTNIFAICKIISSDKQGSQFSSASRISHHAVELQIGETDSLCI